MISKNEKSCVIVSVKMVELCVVTGSVHLNRRKLNKNEGDGYKRKMNEFIDTKRIGDPI